jgi:sec-independent protein translocase protein TatA
MPHLGWPEILVILFVVLVIFGPKRLPEMGRSLGRAIKEFKNAGKEIQKDIVESMNEADRDSTTPANKTTNKIV